MVPMRDGVKLYTAVYEPVGVTGRPIVMMRTPFSLKPYGPRPKKHMREDLRLFMKAGYIIVYQSVRGRYLSEGEFVNVRPLSENGGTDETTDTFDTCEWLLSHTASNGRIGVRGMSYPGFYATMAALSGHPAIKAVSPQAPVTDWFRGDDAHHNGALMLADMYGFGAKFFRPRKEPSVRTLPAVARVTGDIYDYFLGKGTIRNILRPLRSGKTPFWEEMCEHKDYDRFWQERVPTRHFLAVKPAMLFVGGTFDAEDAYGPVACWRVMNEQSPETENHLVLGPWCHGGWNYSDYDHLDGSWFGTGLSKTFKEKIEWPFFRDHLEDLPVEESEPLSKVIVIPSFAKRYVYGGKRKFFPPVRHYAAWPPKGTESVRVYLADGNVSENGRQESLTVGRLSDVPSAGEMTFVSDPSDPVPYREEDSEWRNPAYMAADQRFLEYRDDVLTYIGKPLDRPMRLGGPVRVCADIVTDATDFDLIVKLIDVRPDGYQMLVRGDVMPARYRDSLSSPRPVVPGERTRIEFVMDDIAHDFLKGHSLMVQVQASSFPLVAMNPQKYVENQYDASEYRTASIRVLGDSWISLPKIMIK